MSSRIFMNQNPLIDFTGQNDLATFLKIAQEEGLFVILRPGLYVCAEWEFGGFPTVATDCDGARGTAVYRQGAEGAGGLDAEAGRNYGRN
jgi:beta-galactosidase GanA